jgi:hypothetical protein
MELFTRAFTSRLHIDSGTAALTINAISFRGSNANQFSQTNNCGASLAANADCSITVTFQPTWRGTFSATRNVRDNRPNSPQTATLSGTGL